MPLAGGGGTFGRILARLPRGISLILLATAIAGGCGYVVNAAVGAVMPAAEYVNFGVFWSALYLVIAALSGIQQEVTRATRARVGTRDPNASITRNFAIVVAMLTVVVLLGSSPLWSTAVFGRSGFAFVLAIVIGSASYVVVAVLSGTLYGLQRWPAIALLTSIDGVLRLIAVAIVLACGGGIDALIWAVVVPFPLTPLILWWFIRRSVVGNFTVDVGYRALSWNVSRTVVASVATGVLISGYPLVLRALSPLEAGATLGALIFSINLVRAPLVIVVMSLQSFLVVRFRSQTSRTLNDFWKIAGSIVVVAGVLSVVAAFVVPPILDAFWPGYALEGYVIAGLVAASGVLGVLCVSGPLALARSKHGAFVAGWVGAAVITVLLLLLPGNVEMRMLISLSAGPALGVVVHLAVISLGARRAGPNAAAEL